MGDESTKPKLVVSEPPRSEHDPGSIFDDLDALRKDQKQTVQRQAVLVNVKVSKPPKDTFFRCHRTLRLEGARVVQEKGTDRTTHFVTPAMKDYPKLVSHISHVDLVLTCTWPSGDFLLWPVPVSTKFPVWKSARKACELAVDKWTSMAWSEQKKDYQIEVAESVDHEPEWPNKTFNELLRLGFDEGRIIDTAEHAYVLQLRGRT
jgi:hypothetical protein